MGGGGDRGTDSSQIVGEGESSPWWGGLQPFYGDPTMTMQPHPQQHVPYPWPARPSHGTATAALVCGILGLIAVPGLGVVAWILGHIALQEIDAAPPGAWSNRDHASIGKTLGIVSLVLYGLIILAVVLIYVGLFAVLFVMLGSTG